MLVITILFIIVWGLFVRGMLVLYLMDKRLKSFDDDIVSESATFDGLAKALIKRIEETNPYKMFIQFDKWTYRSFFG